MKAAVIAPGPACAGGASRGRKPARGAAAEAAETRASSAAGTARDWVTPVATAPVDGPVPDRRAEQVADAPAKVPRGVREPGHLEIDRGRGRGRLRVSVRRRVADGRETRFETRTAQPSLVGPSGLRAIVAEDAGRAGAPDDAGSRSCAYRDAGAPSPIWQAPDRDAGSARGGWRLPWQTCAAARPTR